MKLYIKKRNNLDEEFNGQKINDAISKSFKSVNKEPNTKEIEEIVTSIRNKAVEYSSNENYLTVEKIQDLVEIALIDLSYYDVVKSYILYRNKHQERRALLNNYKKLGYNDDLINILRDIQFKNIDVEYSIEGLYQKILSFNKVTLSESKMLDILIKSSMELTSKEFPKWEYISSRFLRYKIQNEINENIRVSNKEINAYYDKLSHYTSVGLYGNYMLENYSKEEVDELEKYIDNSRDELLNYSSLNLLYKRYLLRTFDQKVVETPQELFLGIAMHLGIPEKNNKLKFVKDLYDILSKLKVTFATPTLSNARKPYHQLSSCFIDTVEDSLDGIYKSLDNFAQVSKSGGGMGLYFGKVRANGSDIRGFKGVAGGVIRWIKLANDTAVAVDQLGVRQGAVAVYLDIWHKDIPEFLQIKTNNGDDRMKAHDVFPGICYPDLFWKLAKENLDYNWYLMCPHEIKTVKGYSLEDYYGQEWELKYQDCVNDERISKRVFKIKDLVRLVIKSATETGTPFTFNRDHVNKMNPNKHKGNIYSSNLCTEILQNMSPIGELKQEVMEIEGETVVVEKRNAGDFVVCNLASLVLGNINVHDNEEFKFIIRTVTRALDNVIDLNRYPVPFAKITNNKYRAIGLGVSGYHHMLSNNKIKWESEKHIEFVDKLFEQINYLTIEASMLLAKEKGAYSQFEGSDWENGKYFDLRGYLSEDWKNLKNQVAKDGIRNSYLLAVAPTASTSIIAGTTAGIDPIMNIYYLEEKKGDIVPRVAPNLSMETYWTYKSAHTIEQIWSVKATGARQKHIDQSQSFNLYITTDFTMRQILDLYIKSWELGIKTIYYIRSKSLEVEDCEYCSA